MLSSLMNDMKLFQDVQAELDDSEGFEIIFDSSQSVVNEIPTKIKLEFKCQKH